MMPGPGRRQRRAHIIGAFRRHEGHDLDLLCCIALELGRRARRSAFTIPLRSSSPSGEQSVMPPGAESIAVWGEYHRQSRFHRPQDDALPASGRGQPLERVKDRRVGTPARRCTSGARLPRLRARSCRSPATPDRRGHARSDPDDQAGVVPFFGVSERRQSLHGLREIGDPGVVAGVFGVLGGGHTNRITPARTSCRCPLAPVLMAFAPFNRVPTLAGIAGRPRR